MLLSSNYQKQKLFYIHGYQSSPESNKGRLFKEILNATAIKYRDGKPENLVISKCLKNISNKIKNIENVVLIGSSLGGFLAAETALTHSNVKKLILLNPAIIPISTKYNKFNDVPKSIFEDMKDIRLFKNRIKGDITIIRGTEDEVIPDEWITQFAKYQKVTIILLNDDHRFSRNIKKLPSIIHNILNEK